MMRVLSKHERAWLAHKGVFVQKIARISISQFEVIKGLQQVRILMKNIFTSFNNSDTVYIISALVN